MPSHSERILTTHVGSLPRPDSLVDSFLHNTAGDDPDVSDLHTVLRGAVVDVVRKQHDLGIDIGNDGEYGHAVRGSYDYGPWISYVYPRLGGLELMMADEAYQYRRPREGALVVHDAFGTRRDVQRFKDAYEDPRSGITLGDMSFEFPVARSAVTYIGQQAVERDIAVLKAAMEENGVEDAFVCALSPGTCAKFGNDFYNDDEEALWAYADAMRDEYMAIVDAGLIVQLDDPGLVDDWDSISPAPTPEEYRRFKAPVIEATNHAIRGIPEDRVRFHLCWGSWHGPHTTDIPMEDIVELMLQINAGAYLFEAANVRHEHEWRVWEDVKLPDGKVLVPGVVSHATNVVEHPELVADRIERFARRVGRENVIAGTDCGLGGRIHSQIAWAKLEALSQGAELASRRLWR
jgi:5-methyltetrahydropteroyltriglutamate--homocysteine methyltransferase